MESSTSSFLDVLLSPMLLFHFFRVYYSRCAFSLSRRFTIHFTIMNALLSLLSFLTILLSRMHFITFLLFHYHSCAFLHHRSVLASWCLMCNLLLLSPLWCSGMVLQLHHSLLPLLSHSSMRIPAIL